MIINCQRRVPLTLGPPQKFLSRVRETLRLPDEAVTVCLVSESAMARLNRTFRGQSGPTDVLSFPADGKHRKEFAGAAREPGLPACYLGDIAISPAVARRNTRRDGRSLQNELRILILHGVLHLLGYDHETDHGEMDRRERGLRRRLGLA